MDIYIVFYEAYDNCGQYIFKGCISQNYFSPVMDGDVFISDAMNDAFSDANGKNSLVDQIAIVGVAKL
ncbi:hypothetical protein [Citrobacter portucalensis]|uniref:hypothetical protein n=1 Tax=Citrobacter portucalensis TaxID=1639133 RepID=UPI0039FD1EE4|nr:hypothetical protein [Citrobacter freundii]